jgi:TolB protein
MKVADTALWPAISPDGKRIAYYRMKDEGIYVANIDGGNPQRIVVNETCCVQWSHDMKHLIYVQGKLSIGDTHIKIINPEPGSIPADLDVGPKPFNPAWSPDGAKIAFASCKSNSTDCGIFVYDIKSQVSTMITTDGGGNPQWSPRGDKIVYQAGGTPKNIFVVNPDGSGAKQLSSGKSNDIQPTWSSDGNYVFWRSDQNGKGWAIFVMRADGSDKHLIIDDTPPDQSDKWGGRESLSAGP